MGIEEVPSGANVPALSGPADMERLLVQSAAFEFMERSKYLDLQM